MKEHTVNGNKLIAEFMGWQLRPNEPDNWFNPNAKINWEIFKSHEFVFHEDWSALMQACEKFNSIYDGKHISQSTRQYNIYATHCEKIAFAVSCYDKSLAWENLVRGIRWLNQQKTTS